MSETQGEWEENDSLEFIGLGDLITPSRLEQIDLVAKLLPAEVDEHFSVVDLACGTGALTEAVLRKFPHSAALALDGSLLMRHEAARRLSVYGTRVRCEDFDLRERDWLQRIPSDVRCFLSSLAIHHLDAAGKQRLFRDLVSALPPGGGILIIDLVEPVNQRVWRAYGDAWDSIARTQSQEQTGSEESYARFRAGWNYYRDPDEEFDHPSGLFEQLRWLGQAGLTQVDCFWLRAGHAIYGGYR